MNLHEEAIRMLKKGLGYSWYLKNTEEEIRIYELLGLEHFALVNMNKAAFYHHWSIQNLTECHTSQSYLINQQFLHNQFTFYKQYHSRY